MNLSSTEMIIAAVAVVVVLLAIAATVAFLRRKRRRERLQERFGRAEYERAVDRAGSERAAEEQLEQQRARRERLEIRELSSGDRALYRGRFEAIEASFLDGPEAAVRNADELLDEVAGRKGYPDASADQRLDDLAVDHAAATDRYRSSRASRDKDGSSATTEQHRQALLGSRALFEALVGEDPDGPTTGSLAFRDLIAEDEGDDASNGHRHHEPTGH